MSNKRSYFLAYALMICVFAMMTSTSCKNEVAEINNDLIGLWNRTSISTVISVGSLGVVQYLIDEHGLSQSDAETYENNLIFEFENYAFTSIEFRSDGVYTVQGSGYGAKEGKWNLSDDNKTLTIDNDLVIIIALTSTKLSFQFSFDSEDEFTDTCTYNVIMNFEGL